MYKMEIQEKDKNTCNTSKENLIILFEKHIQACLLQFSLKKANNTSPSTKNPKNQTT